MPQSTYQPINGREAKEVLIRSLTRHIMGDRDISLFKEGNAFHRIELGYALTVTAYPADCPVPELEFKEAIKPPGLTDEILAQIEKTTKASEELEKKKAELLAGVEKIDKLLNKIRPTIEIEDIHIAGDTPDNLRQEFGLATPQIVTKSILGGGTKKVEEFVKPATITK